MCLNPAPKNGSYLQVAKLVKHLHVEPEIVLRGEQRGAHLPKQGRRVLEGITKVVLILKIFKQCDYNTGHNHLAQIK